MKTLLQVVGYATIAAGLIMFFVAVRADLPNTLAFSWIVSGVVGASLFLGLAHVIGMLEDISARLPSAYRSSSSPRGQTGAFRDDPNPPGWNDPK